MKSTLTLPVAALLTAAAAQKPITLGNVPSGLSDKAWDSVAKSANITDVKNFTGRDVSSPYPGSDQKGWEVSLALKDNVDIPRSGDLLTATTLTISAPDGNTTIDDSWRVCAHVFPVKDSSSDGFGHEFEPGCKGLVASECVDDLIKTSRSKFDKGCPPFKITPSCLRDLEDQKGYSAVLNDNLIGGNTSFYHRADGTHAASNDSHAVYLDAALHPLAVVNVFGASGKSDDEPHVEVRCVLPGTVVGDSVDPTPDAASDLTRFAGWAALTGAVALQFLF